ncbi:MAG: glycosyltransferase [Chloroflexi bacterium]|uniref:Glycosyltransferase n=1 Tax=Candidatus Chlorohelix allophototropha TaxID=3003348 RepID=A0A8T7LUD8_9CHLR|nr:glycosyltransferase [Chloroflexota bacterium]WJW66386.1 glycosyltransferase [Chloroflexota bacterium L227-S17]
MRILYAIMSYGPQVIASEVHSEIISHYRQNGHKVDVISLADYSGSGEVGAKAFANEAGEVKIHAIRFKRNLLRRGLRWLCGRTIRYAFFLELLWGYVIFLWKHRRDYDFIHVEAAFPLGAVVAISSLLIKLPFVVHLQGADVTRLPEYDYGYARYFMPRMLARFAFRRALGIRAISEVNEAYGLQLGANPDKMTVILLNISDNVYPSAGLDLAENKKRYQQELRERYGLNPGPILISFGRLHPVKGIDWLIKAMPEIRRRYGDINLLVCGPSRITPRFGDYRRYLEDLANKVGAKEDVVFTGKIDFSRSQDYLAGADLVIVPSLREALNKVVMEAAAVGTPSVVTRTSGVALYASKAGAAISVDPFSAEALAEGILEALPKLNEMGKQGPAFAVQYNSTRTGERLLEFYKGLLDPSKKKKTNFRLCYVAYPSSLTLKSANAIQTYTTCRELKHLNQSTEVLIPRLLSRPSRFADLEVRARHLPRLPLNYFSNFPLIKKFPWSYAERAFFALLVGFWLVIKRVSGRGYKVIYSRDVIVTYFLLRYWRKLIGAKIIYEAHDLEQRNPSRAKSLKGWLEKVDHTVMGKADGVVSLTQAFVEYATAQGYRAKNKGFTVIPDAFDDSVYRTQSQQESRKKLDIPLDAFIVAYSGLTFAYRSLDKLLEAFSIFVKQESANAYLYLVGGRPFEQEEMKAIAIKLGISERVKCVGQIAPDRVNLYLNAASLLAIPDTVTDITASPLKMFEYAAVGRPVMLPELPALQEILGQNEAFYFKRGEVTAMKEALCRAYCNLADANKLGEKGRLKVLTHTYANRARAILDFAAEIQG